MPVQPSALLRRFALATAVGLSLVPSLLALAAPGDDFDLDPIRYTATQASDPIASLQGKLKSGDAVMTRNRTRGYLDSLLRNLGISPSSQSLVFSKTSLQHDRISPTSPRALYFNDDVYVGWIQGSPILEIAAVDPRLGAVFYTLNQDAAPPQFVRQNYECLSCHSSTLTGNVPGFTVRSVFPARDGRPILSAGTHITRDSSPIEERWGGWYVTGAHGKQQHMGNSTLRDQADADAMDRSRGANVTSLDPYFDTSPYLTPHSDLVALMVLQHQTHFHNQLTRANWETRKALHYEESLARELGRPGERLESTRGRIRSGCEPLVRALFFSEEAPLQGRVSGTTSFAREFEKPGPRDARGRSLRELNLERRLFRYPCSFLIQSPSFDALPPEARDYVYGRMWQILLGEDDTKYFAHLTAADRQAIIEILSETKPAFAAARPVPAASG